MTETRLWPLTYYRARGKQQIRDSLRRAALVPPVAVSRSANDQVWRESVKVALAVRVAIASHLRYGIKCDLGADLDEP